MHRLQDLVRLHREGLPARSIARCMRMGRNTVARYMRVLGEAGLLEGQPDDLPDVTQLRDTLRGEELPELPAQQRSSVERWFPIIDVKWRAGVGPTAIFDYLRTTHDDFDGSLSAVKRRCAMLRRQRGVRAEEVAIPVETAPGEIAQVDFGYVGKLRDPETGQGRKAWVFVMTLGFSRHLVARIVFDQRVETWLRLHIECFEALGGVPKVIVPDNLKAAVITAAFGPDGETQLNRSYRELARHYGFIIDPTPPRAPQKKGKVEAGVRYVKSNYFRAHAPTDIREARAGLERWLHQVAGQRVHGTTRKQPALVFQAEERAQLHPLPRTRFDLVTWCRAKVQRDSHVNYRGELYSVPWRLIDRQVELRITHSEVCIHHDDELVARHDRGRKGERTTVEGHLPVDRAALRERDPAHWQRVADAMGEPVGEYVRAVFASDDVLSKLRRVQAVVRCLQRVPEHRARAACVRALHFRNFTVAGIKNILARDLDLVALPGDGNKLHGHWSQRPRFSRVSPRPNDDDEPRPDAGPQEAPAVRDPRDDGSANATGHR